MSISKDVIKQCLICKLAHEDWKSLLIAYDEEGTEERIPVVPVWKWLMEG